MATTCENNRLCVFILVSVCNVKGVRNNDSEFYVCIIFFANRIVEVYKSYICTKHTIMIDLAKINIINSVIQAYFEHNKELTIVPVKELMPDFIAAKIFQKDFKNGKSIREILRELDSTNQRELIPYMHSEIRDEHTYWYFIPADAPKPTTLYKQELAPSKRELAEKARSLSDETYVIDLCDSVLEEKAERQKRFDFLLGDLHKDGITRTKLPVGAYYESVKIVIEYKESPQTISLAFANRADAKTISGVTREAQRLIYDQRRVDELPKHGILLINIAFDTFKCDKEFKIVRNPKKDKEKIEAILNKAKLERLIEVENTEEKEIQAETK